MTVEIISWSISTKVWDRARIELASPDLQSDSHLLPDMLPTALRGQYIGYFVIFLQLFWNLVIYDLTEAHIIGNRQNQTPKLECVIKNWFSYFSTKTYVVCTQKNCLI